MSTSSPAPRSDDLSRHGDQASDPWRDATWAVLSRIRSLVEGPAIAADVPAAVADAVEPVTLPLPVVEPAMAAPPVDGDTSPMAVERAFAFVDISGFTAFCDRHGERAAIEVLTRFRTVTRDVVGRRGVRASKWLGDGVMLVSTEPGPLVAAVVELECRFRATGLETHAGVAWGPVLLFEGDDYVGRTVNLAARLADAAGPGEVLAVGVDAELPAWIERRNPRSLQVAGMGRVDGVVQLAATPEVERTLLVAA